MAGLSKRQLEALREMAVDTNVVLGSDEAMKGLNEEIVDMVNTFGVKDDDKAPLVHTRGTASQQTPLRRNEPAAEKAIPTVREEKKAPRAINKQVSKPQPQPIIVEATMEDLDSELDRQIEDARRQKQALAEKKAALEAAQAAKVVQQPEPEPEASFKSQIEEMLSKIEGAPSRGQIEEWKKEGTLHATAFSETDIFLFTYLKRSQWNKIKELVETKAETISGTDSQRDLKEKVVKSCVRWPNVRKDEFTYSAPAGLVDTLFDLIMLHSYFLTTQQAMQLTTTL